MDLQRTFLQMTFLTSKQVYKNCLWKSLQKNCICYEIYLLTDFLTRKCDIFHLILQTKYILSQSLQTKYFYRSRLFFSLLHILKYSK